MSEAFDYIVVGAGSAGCVLAARLSEAPATRVLLLEAGPPDRSPWIHLPIGYGKTMWSRCYNWCFETEPEPNMGGRRRARRWWSSACASRFRRQRVHDAGSRQLGFKAARACARRRLVAPAAW